MAIVIAGLAPTTSALADEHPVEPTGYVPRGTGVTAPARPPTQRILYLNFEGGDIEWCGSGEDDPHNNCSTIFQGAVAPYRRDEAARAAVVQTVRADLVDFNVLVTTERPPDDIDYDMEMIGEWSPLPTGGFLGIAPKIDCFDGDGGDLSFTLDPLSLQPADTAKVVLQEAAHTWGLEHVDSTGDLLFPTVGNAPNPKFEDSCSPIVYDPQECPEQHAMFCEPPSQNSHAEMLMLFGPREPDTTPPTLEILSPQDGSVLPHDFHVVLELHDEVAPQVLDTTVEFVGGFSSDVSLSAPGVFPIALTGVVDGEWTVRVTATDPDGNTTEQEIDIVVGTPEAHADSGTSSGGEAPTSAGGSSGTGDASGGETGGGSGESSGNDGGCGCTHERAPTPLWSAPLLLLLARRRRN